MHFNHSQIILICYKYNINTHERGRIQEMYGRLPNTLA